MGRSEEQKDIFGDRYTQHYDDEGRETGRTEVRKDMFGDEYEQHVDRSGRETGRSEKRRDLFGDEYQQHKDEKGRDAGRSEERRDMFGDEYVEHFDEQGRRIGRSERRRDMFGDEFVEHQMEDQRRGTFSEIWGRRDWSSNPANIVWSLLWMMFIVTIGFIYAIFRYRHVRAAYFMFVSLAVQWAVFLSLQQSQPGAIGTLMGATGAALAGILLYRLSFSLLRLGGPQEARANAWAISGALAAVSVVVNVVLVVAEPNLTAPSLEYASSRPDTAVVAPQAAPPRAVLALSSSRVAAIVNEGPPAVDMREFEAPSPVGYSADYANAHDDTIHVTLNANGQDVDRCAPYTLNGNGRYHCQFQSLAEGEYSFRVYVNGAAAEELPFAVRAKGSLPSALSVDPSVQQQIAAMAAASSSATASEEDLAHGIAGQWRGEYWGENRRPIAIEMNIVTSAETISGSGAEPRLLGPLYLGVSGSIRADRSVSFAMRTDGGYVVRYDGVLSDDGTIIAGQWQRGHRSGEFRLQLVARAPPLMGKP